MAAATPEATPHASSVELLQVGPRVLCDARMFSVLVCLQLQPSHDDVPGCSCSMAVPPAASERVQQQAWQLQVRGLRATSMVRARTAEATWYIY